MYSKKNTFKGFSETTSVNQVVDKWTHSGLKSWAFSYFFACAEKLLTIRSRLSPRSSQTRTHFNTSYVTPITAPTLTFSQCTQKHTSLSLSHNTHSLLSQNPTNLFFSSLCLYHTHTCFTYQIVSLQVDFVPTFSLLLGLPIPFSNLGAVIPDALTQSDEMFSATKQLQYIGLNLDQGNLNRRWC